MIAVRHLLAQRRLAVLICAAALLLKLLVPTGYMMGNDHGAPGIVICPGAAPMMTMSAGDGAMAAMHDTAPEQGPSKEHGKSEMPCAYAGLSAQMLGAVDPVVLVAALAVMAAMALLLAPRRVHRSAHHLRPPLRGPPLPRD